MRDGAGERGAKPASRFRELSYWRHTGGETHFREQREDSMAFFERDDIKIYYEESGDGFPILLFAPGGMRSTLQVWTNSPFNPIEVLADHFRVIAMDQRNAGRSVAPISADDGWHAYTADHLALLDHLGIDHVINQLEKFGVELKTDRFKPSKVLLELKAKGKGFYS